MGSFSVNPEDFLAEESRRKSAFQVSPEDFLKGEQSPGLMSSLAQPVVGMATGTVSALKSIGGTLELLPKAANIATGHYGVQEDIGRWVREKAGGIEKNMPQGRVTNLEQIKGPRDLLDWTTFNVGNALPSMGVSMAGGVAGGLLAGPTGAAVGAGGMSYLLNAGEVYANLRDQGIDAPKASAIAGIPMAVLDMVVPKMEAGKLVWKLAGQEGAEEAVKTGLKAAAKKTLQEAGTEGITEAGQEAISDVTEQLSGAQSQPALAHVLRILNAGAAGAVGGAGTSAIVDALPTRAKREQQAAAEDEATATEILNQPAVEPPVPTPTTASSVPSGGLAVPTGTTPQNTVTGPGNGITETAPAPTVPEMPRRITWKNIDGKSVEGELLSFDKDGDGLAEVRPDGRQEVVKMDVEQFEPAQDQMPVAQESLDFALPYNIHETINQRNTVFHATDLEGFKGILEAGEISPNPWLHQGMGKTAVKAAMKAAKMKEGFEVFDTVTGKPIQFVKTEDEAKQLVGDSATLDYVFHDKTGAEVSEFELPVSANPDAGVSVSRVPRIAPKAEKAISFVIDRAKMPRNRGFAEEGYRKTTAQDKSYLSYLDQEEQEKYKDLEYLWKENEGDPTYASKIGAQIDALRDIAKERAKLDTKRNPHFEFEDRTYNEPIPLSAVKGVLIDKSALGYPRLSGRFAELAAQKYFSKSFMDLDHTEISRLQEVPIEQLANEVGYDLPINAVRKLAAAKGLPVRVFNSGKEMHTYRAGLGVVKQAFSQSIGTDQNGLLNALFITLPNGTVLTDAEGKLSEAEAQALAKNQEFTALAKGLEWTLSKSRELLGKSSLLPVHMREVIKANLPQIRIAFSEKYWGVNLKRFGLTEALEIHPFAYEHYGEGSGVAPSHDPANIASMVWGVIKEEITHELVQGHDENFVQTLNLVSRALGGFEVRALSHLKGLYGTSTELRSGIADALRIYEESRGRSDGQEVSPGGEGIVPGSTEQRSAGSQTAAFAGTPTSGSEPVGGSNLPQGRAENRGDFGTALPGNTEAVATIKAAQQAAEGVPIAETAVDVPPEAHAVAGVVQLNLDGIGATKGPDGLTTAQANDIARSLKKFGMLQKWSSTLLQWGYRYPALKPLTDYIANIEAWQKRANDIRVEADELITLMQKLGKDRLNKLATMTFTVGELSYRRGRRLTDEEIISIAQKFKIDSDTMQVFQALDVNFLTALRQMQKAMVEEAKWHLANSPTELKARIEQINSDFDKMAERNYFPRSRFGNYNIIFRPSEDVTYEGATFKKGRQVVLAFEEERVRNAEWKKLREALKGKLIDAEEPTRDIFSDEERAFVGFPPALFESFEEKLNLTAEQKTKLKNIALDLSPGISFLKHLKKQKGIAGYSQDLLRVTADYYQHYANHLARIEYRAQLGKNLAEMGEFVNKIKSGDRANARKIQMAMKQHFGYVMNPGNDLPALRGWMYNYFFAFVPKQVLVNLTQVPFFSQQYLAATSGLPPIKADWAASRALTSAAIDITRLFQVDKTKKGRAAIGAVVGAAVSAPFMGPAGIVTGAIEGAGYGLSSRTDLMSGQQLKEYGKKLEADPNFASKSKLSLADVEFLQWGVQMGFLDQSFATELASVARGNVLTRMFPGSSIADKWARKITAVGTAPFSLSEKYNRFVTGLAAFRMAQARGMSQEEAQGFAKEAVQRTMFEYARHNRPRLMQGKKASLFMFMSYLQHATYFAVASPGALRWWLAMLLFAGIKGLPWAEDAMEIFNFAGSFLKSKLGLKNPRVDLEKEIREMAIAIGANPNHALYGLSRDTFGIAPLGHLAGIPIPSLDFWPSIQQGRVLRGLSPTLQALQGQLKPAEYVGQLTQELAGAAGGTGMNMLKATLGAGVDPLSTRVLQIMMPNAIRNLARASRYDKEMEATDLSGNPVVKFAPDSVQQQGEIIGQMLGVQPSRLSNAKDMLWSYNQMKAYYVAKREGLYNDFAAARISGDREAMADAKQSWRDYNNTVPPEFRVSASALVQSLKNRMMNRKLAEKGLPLQKDYIRLYRDWQSAFPQE